MTAEQLAILAAGIFFTTGLVTGIWKYRHIMASDDAKAPYYVNIAHRTALLYSFAAILLAEFAARSAWSETVDFLAVLVSVLFFGGAIASYALHGLLRDTDNQFARPHRLGHATLPGGLIGAFMWLLIVAELGGFLVLFSGVLVAWYG